MTVVQMAGPSQQGTVGKCWVVRSGSLFAGCSTVVESLRLLSPFPLITLGDNGETTRLTLTMESG